MINEVDEIEITNNGIVRVNMGVECIRIYAIQHSDSIRYECHNDTYQMYQTECKICIKMNFENFFKLS